MSDVLHRMKLGASAQEDMVVVQLGTLRAILPYQSAFEIAQGLRMAAKEAARFDRAPATFTHEVTKADPREDLPEYHPQYRRGTTLGNIKNWDVRVIPPLVGLVFDDTLTEFSYEDAVHLAWYVRRAGHIAKRWAGDRSRVRRARGNLHDAEENYRLGIA